MAPVGESNQSQVEETQGAQPEHASEAGEEISRQAKQELKVLNKDLPAI